MSTTHILDRLCAIGPKPKKPVNKYKVKRLVTKRVKKLERPRTQGDVLVGEDATLYRALAARANFLALDRPDLAYATKELCRDFSAPTTHSVWKLRRLIRCVHQFPGVFIIANSGNEQ